MKTKHIIIAILVIVVVFFCSKFEKQIMEKNGVPSSKTTNTNSQNINSDLKISDKKLNNIPITGAYIIKVKSPSTIYNKEPEIYTGEIIIEKKGQIYEYVEKNSGSTTTNNPYKGKGVGLYNQKNHTLAFMFKGDDHTTGCELLSRTKDGFKGTWTFFSHNSGNSGTEILIKK